MKRRIFAALLAGAMVLALAACGGNGGGSSSGSGGGSSSVDASSSQNGGSSADASLPDASLPDASQPDGSASSSEDPQPDGSGASSAEDALKPLPTVTLTLNKTKVTLNKAGATFRLRYTAEPDTDGTPTFSSSDKKVATVAEDGTIKAVAPGKATITVTYDGATAKATVTCDWTEEKPAEPSKPSGDTSKPSGDTSKPSEPAPAKVDLQSFYDTTVGKYEFGFLELADNDLLDMFYSGLTGVSTEQSLVYICQMSMNNGEFGLVQVKDSKDVDTVKAIFQARIDYMAGDDENQGGAFYPGAMEQWALNSRVVSNGNYVMMVVHENCNDIVNEFNALF